MIGSSLSVLLLADAWGMHDSDIGTGWMIVMMLGMIVFWGLVILGIVWLLREAIGRDHHATSGDALGILDRRLAEGQISVEEYEQSRRVLASPPPESGQ